MQWRIGALGIGLVAAFVVGGLAQDPPIQNYPGGIVVAPGPSDQAAFNPGLSNLDTAVAAPASGAAPSNYVIPPNLAAETGAGQSPPAGAPARGGVAGGIASMQLETTNSGPQAAAAGELIGFNGFDGSGSQTITLVHTGKMQIAVYHIDRSGQIRLVSSRPIDADFSVSLNVNAPLPGEIRRLSGPVK